MARDSQRPEISESSLEAAVTSADLLKQAWESMGRTSTGDRIEDEATGSSGRTAAANQVSSLTSMVDARAASAEEIAQLLRDETARRETTQSGPTPPPLERPSQPPPPRPRRAEPIFAPPRPTETAPQPSRPQQPRRAETEQSSRRRRRGLGWIVFAVIWLVSSVVGTFLENNESNDPPAVTIEVPDVSIDTSDLTSTTLSVSGSATTVSIRDLEPGACIASLPIGDVINDVATVPCDELHQYELYANAVLSGDEYPGDDVFDEAFEACDVYFENYIGEPYASSEWFVDVITPTRDGWELAKDRSVNCLVYLWDEDAAEVAYVSGSARGSGDPSS